MSKFIKTEAQKKLKSPSERTFHKYEIILTVLSEDPIEDIDDVIFEMDDNVVVEESFVQHLEELNSKETVSLFEEINQDPYIFRLDKKGNDVE